MSKVKRVYSEKMPEFAVKAKELSEEISSYLNINTVTNVRVLYFKNILVFLASFSHNIGFRYKPHVPEVAT